MEIIWYLLASIGAGVGTGLAGLSAATVMVPILIVLCPSFSGETGAYQATAIALASDILGSAVTAYTYWKKGNINLRRGWIMMACIVTMCTVGSYVAWLAGNRVLGSFTLFLTFFIGIRFLVKPDTSPRPEAKAKTRFDWKDVCVSLFFGLTIGFGTGFVGTGGGMMMLIVFTVFLGMDLKSAVGTSTFIMTFTALIASVSHIMIHPAIVFDRWQVLLVCMVVATVASLLSARFANRVDNRTVGLVTGSVLTVMGGLLLILHYRDTLIRVPYLQETLSCLLRLCLYLVPCVLILLPLRFRTKIPSYIFRKCLHLVAFTCVALMIHVSDTWQAAALCSLMVAVLVYPILKLLENRSWYDRLFVQKSRGEIKRSLLMLFCMFAALTYAGWGIAGKKDLVTCAILMWGIGDGMAAIIGIPFGRHKVKIGHIAGSKSWEGTAAMLVSSCLAGVVLLMCLGLGLVTVLPGVFLAAVLGSAVELLSPSEWDTVTVPACVLIILLACL